MASEQQILESLKHLVPDLLDLRQQKPGFSRFCKTGRHEGIGLHLHTGDCTHNYLGLSLGRYHHDAQGAATDVVMQIEVEFSQGVARAVCFDRASNPAPVRLGQADGRVQRVLNDELAEWLGSLWLRGITLPSNSEVSQ